MASYNPPTEDLSSFNSGVFNAVSGDSSLTISQGDTRYLRFPLGQGAETLPSVSITGTANIGGATTMSGSASVSGTTTMSDTIALNKASGSQSVVCSAPSGLAFSTNVNQAPITFSCQSSNGTFNNVLQIIANANPRVSMNVADARIIDRTNSTYITQISNPSGSTLISNTSTAGNGGITLDASTSTAGNGAITLTTKNGTASATTGLILNGDTLTSSTAGAHGGLHLRLTINGVQYKIALLANS
jgi:hypothetical protein